MKTRTDYTIVKETMAAVAIIWALSATAVADDFSVRGSPLDGDRLPQNGTATYTGTWAGSSIEFFVDFATDAISADLTIPALGSGASATPPEHYTPSGRIVRNGADPAGFTLTQGVSSSPDSPFISISGTFTGPAGHGTTGSFEAKFCVPKPPGCFAGVGNYVMRTVTGTFLATAQPVFDGTPGKANCPGQSVSALAHQYGGLNGASEALGYASVGALEEAIEGYCEG
jgi:hypothetical protein